MSGVYARNRKSTKADFVETTWELRKYTLKICVKFPRKYKEWITDYIVRFSAEAQIHAFEANRIFPKTKEDVQKRKEELNKAYGALDQMYEQIDLAYQTFRFDNSTDGKTNAEIIESWLPMLSKSQKLIKAVIASDRRRSKDLP